MRLVARQAPFALLEYRESIDGYVVDGNPRDARSDVRYPVRTPDGDSATLVMSRRAITSRSERVRFVRLARLRTSFSHPAALDVLDFGEHAGRPYFVTERLPQRTLGDLLRDEGPLEPQRALAMLAPIALALDAAHGRGLVHQALGTDTLLLTRDGRVLLDWFALFDTGEEAKWWGVGTWGELRYTPPEQLRGLPIGASGNVYSLTAVIVHALTGEPPYSSESSQLAYAHLAAPPPALSARMPRLGHAVDGVVASGLAKSSFERPPSATALIAQLADALQAVVPRPAAESSPQAAEAAWRRPRRRRRIPRLAVALTVAAIAGALAAVALRPFADDGPKADSAPAAASVWKRLDSQRSDLRAQLAGAETPSEQADIAGRLAGAYAEAARAAASPPQARAARDVRDAYQTLAAAAESGNEAGYGLAAAAVAQAEQRLQARR